MANVIDAFAAGQTFESFLVTMFSVLLISGAAWLMAKRVASAALRHLILISALFCCLAIPGLAWMTATSGLRLAILPTVGLPAEDVPHLGQFETNEAVRALASTRSQPADERARVASQQTVAEPINAEPQGQDSGAGRTTQSSKSTSAPRAAADVKEKGKPAHDFWQARSIFAVIEFVWAVGVVLLVARLARDYLRLVWLRREARSSHNQADRELLHAVASRLGARRLPQLLISRRAATPLAIGILRPAVVLPVKVLDATTDEELSDIFVHEVTHLVRRDQHVVLLECLAAQSIGRS